MVSDGRCHCRGCDQARLQGAEDVAKRIRELHQPITGPHDNLTCKACAINAEIYPDWPCPTIKALDGEQ